MKSAVTIGIDFGASFSTAAALVGDRVHFALDGRGEACIPSAVYFPPKGAPIVGADAVAARSRDPADVAVGFKRLLGSEYDSPARRFADAVTALKIKRTQEGGITIQTPQGDRTPIEIASIVMRELKSILEARLRTKIERAIVTVPARASDSAKRDTMTAAKMAGLRSVELLAEPVAAALSFGAGASQADRRFLVYDFGGGTFDATAVAQHGTKFDVFASDGDECLGGDNFDAELARWLAGEMWRTAGRDPSRDRIVWDRVIRFAELGKRALSASNETTVRIEDGSLVAIKVARPVVESIWQELVERSIVTSAQTVVAAGWRHDDLNRVMMVGGTTFIPMIQSRVKQVFRIPCEWSTDAQTAVASGAAWYAAGRVSASPGRGA